MHEINETHDQNLKSWIESANAPDTDFPIQNLPFCSFQSVGKQWRTNKIGIRIGDFILDLDKAFHESALEWFYEKHGGDFNEADL